MVQAQTAMNIVSSGIESGNSMKKRGVRITGHRAFLSELNIEYSSLFLNSFYIKGT